MVKDLKGQVFGHLTVISRINDPTAGQTPYWWCRCACGEGVGVAATELVTGSAWNCSRRKSGKRALQAIKCVNPPPLAPVRKRPTPPLDPKWDITGQKFGAWTVIRKAVPDGRKGLRWECRCECGAVGNILASKLRAGARGRKYGSSSGCSAECSRAAKREQGYDLV